MKTKNLTIQEAIQSGLPFKREIWTEFYVSKNFDGYSIKDILATDWQIQVPEVTITREKLAEALNKADKEIVYTNAQYVDIVAEALGL